jgi:hypothetical protein
MTAASLLAAAQQSASTPLDNLEKWLKLGSPLVDLDEKLQSLSMRNKC